MKKNLWWLMIVIVFVAGLLVSNLLVQANEKVDEVQWEYKAVTTKSRASVEEQLKQDLPTLNKHGRNGWELCGVHYSTYYFKKEISKQ